MKVEQIDADEARMLALVVVAEATAKARQVMNAHQDDYPCDSHLMSIVVPASTKNQELIYEMNRTNFGRFDGEKFIWRAEAISFVEFYEDLSGPVGQNEACKAFADICRGAGFDVEVKII